MLKIYVAGPLSTGDYTKICHNVTNAMAQANKIMEMGGYPYLPHLSHYFNLHHAHSWEEWMALDKVYLKACDALLRLPGESRGADQEVKWAAEFGIPVYHTIEEVSHALCQARDKASAGAGNRSATR